MKRPDDISAAVAALKAGKLILLPTETVYGLAADAADPMAVAAIFEAKGRPRFNPLIAHVADLAHAHPAAGGGVLARAPDPRRPDPRPLGGLRPGPRRPGHGRGPITGSRAGP